MTSALKLSHGGIMANYKCTAACRHCLYACSPERAGGYMAKETAASICELLRAAGCRSAHIGGGEPFLDFGGLIELVRAAIGAGISVEYIETNAYWASDKLLAKQRLRELAQAGADTLCISIDPFHAEYVPFGLPIVLSEACRSIGFNYFLWQDRYLHALSRLEPGKTHTRAEMEKLISPAYVLETAKGYGLRFGGRALNIETEYSVRKPVDDVKDSSPCLELLSGNHFHVDLYGRFIPPGCTGIAIPLDEAVSGIPDGKYPVFETLLRGGSAGLLQYAEGLGFQPDAQGYTSSCALCFYIRRWLCDNDPSPELDAEHYAESLKYY